MDKILECLKTAPRIGAEKDEPEGSRYIQISETLVNEFIETLEEIAKMLEIYKFCENERKKINDNPRPTK